jgi:hypothetical protein
MATSTIDISKLTFKAGFKPTNIRVLHDKGRTFVAAFDNEYANKRRFNIRELYEEYGVWCPGKGIAIAIEKKADFLKTLADYCVDEISKAG